MNNICYSFDFCNTLVKSNTTLDFIRFYSKKSIFFFFKAALLFFIAKFLFFLKCINQNEYIKIRVFCFFGEKEEKIKYFANEFALVLEEKIIISSFNAFHEYIKNTKKVIIISNSLDFIIESFLEHKNIRCKVDVISSNLLMKNGVCLGFYNLFMQKNGKLKNFNEKFNFDFMEYWTDDLIADKDICDGSESVYFINNEKVLKIK